MLLCRDILQVITYFRNAKKTEDKVTNLEEELKETREKMVEHEETFKQLEKDAMSVMQAYNKANVRLGG